ncbi:T9SS type A sorting domain-containing protein [candidate division KSB1 bacterium]|nr:T9SS type A sorting domain-containing protein [candidate division KSB1 bacterium]
MTYSKYIPGILCLLFFSYPSVPYAQTTVSGAVSGTWSKDKSPYIVIGDLSIKYNSILVIQAGVQVYFHENVKFTIGAKFNQDRSAHRLIAVGTPTDSIYFSAYNKPEGWAGLRFEETSDDDILSYVVISEIKKTDAYNQPEMDYTYGGIEIVSSDPKIINSRIIGNTIADGAVISCYLSSPHVSNCIFANNIKSTDHEQNEWSNSKLKSSFVGCHNSNIRFDNTLIYDNSVDQFLAGMNGSLITFINVTMSHNIFNINYENISTARSFNNKLYFLNTIIHQNQATFLGIFDCQIAGDSIEFHYCDVDTSMEYFSNITNKPDLEQFESWKRSKYIIWNAGNLFIDPAFVDPIRKNYFLQTSSRCLDAGDPNPAYNDWANPDKPDLALFPGQRTVRNDMGAYGGKSTLGPPAANIDINSTHENCPGTYYLSNNFPNPFNLSTTFTYIIPEPQRVQFTVYNLLGQKINTMATTLKTAGIYSIEWNGCDDSGKPMPSGIYICRFRAGQFHQTQKMVLVR